MSYQLDLQKNGKLNIEMPPLPAEVPEVLIVAQPDEVVGEDTVENVDYPAQATPEAVSEPLQVAPAEESFQAKNFRQLRQEAERVKQDNAEMVKRLQAYEAAEYRSRTQQQPTQQDEVEYNINADDLVEGKHLQQYAKKMKQLETQLQQQQQANVATMAQSQLRMKFPDFDKVVNEDNIEQLRYAYPELANTLNSSTDLYSTAVSAYTMIKNLGIVPKGDDFMAQKAQAQKNAAKPKPLASVNPQQGDSPLSKANAFANGLTPELQKQLRKEMEQARANH